MIHDTAAWEPADRANWETVSKLIETTTSATAFRRFRRGTRVADALLDGPFRAAYDAAVAGGDTRLADTFAPVGIGFLSGAYKGGQKFRVLALLASRADRGDTLAAAMVRTLSERSATPGRLA